MPLLGSNLRRKFRAARSGIVHVVRRLRRAVLVISGLGCLTAAAWTFGLAAGLSALGVALLVLDLSMGEGEPE